MPCAALDHAVAGRHRAAGETLDAEQVEADGGAGDVGDAVERPDLVKMHLLQRHAVDRRLRLAQPAEDAHGQVTLLRAQAAAAQDGLDLRQVTVAVLVRGLDPHVRRREAALAHLLDDQAHRSARASRCPGGSPPRPRRRRSGPPASCRR